MHQPLVSVILPFYNQEAFVKVAIESILCQSLTDFELLVLDDGSTDNSANIIQWYAQRDSRVKAFFTKNKGKCAAINFLLTKAKGKYCAFMDGDDCMLPTRLEEQVAVLETNPVLAGVSCHCDYIDEQGAFMGRQRYPHLSSIAANEEARKSGAVVLFAFTGFTIRKDLFVLAGGLDGRFWPCEDLELANRLLDQGFDVLVLNRCLMSYRIHRHSVTGSQWWQMRKKSAWTHQVIRNRRKGVEAQSYESYEMCRSNKGLLTQLNFYRAGFSILYQRKAVFALFRKRFTRAIYCMMIAFCLRPAYGWALLKNKCTIQRNTTSCTHHC